MVASVAPIKSASGAASYFAQDNYYTAEDSSLASEWAGTGAAELGLSGAVDKDDFENILNSKLPDGTVVNSSENRRLGDDITLSAPKSVSIMALVAGDKRVLQAHTDATKATVKWMERFAEARVYDRVQGGEPIRTGNLVVGTFVHDTSRKLDPQLHTHLVIAPITKMADGTWRALWNKELYMNNTAIGSAYHAFLREKLVELGYNVEVTGKHGQFEISGISDKVLNEFSQRRIEIIKEAERLGIKTPEGRDKVVLTTRDAKISLEDRGALVASWKDRAAEHGFDGKDLQAKSVENSKLEDPLRAEPSSKLMAIADSAMERVKQYLLPNDPLTTNGIARLVKNPNELRTEMAVASAIRILGQREAVFDHVKLGETALNLGLRGVTPDRVEERIGQLKEGGKLIPGQSDRRDELVTRYTTPEHIDTERKILSQIEAGKGQGETRVDQSTLIASLQANTNLTSDGKKIVLKDEQLDAAKLILSSPDRVVAVQGVAGAGKSTLFYAVARVAQQSGQKIEGIALANKMVTAIRDDAEIEASTVSAFVNKHLRGVLQGHGPRFDESRKALAGSIVLLDEASQVPNEQMLNLAIIANKLGIARLAIIGDRDQLLSVDAGKAFALVQSKVTNLVKMVISTRQVTDVAKKVADLSRIGLFKETFAALGDKMVSAGDTYRKVAAETYLNLTDEKRNNTVVITSGLASRREINDLIQAGLKSEGTITGDGQTLRVRLRMRQVAFAP